MQEQSRTNKVARQKQLYNRSSGTKSFLQWQHELAEKKGESVDCVELFRKTHVWAGTFVSQAGEDEHVSYWTNTYAFINYILFLYIFELPNLVFKIVAESNAGTPILAYPRR